jgi:HEAT repeat protein
MAAGKIAMIRSRTRILIGVVALAGGLGLVAWSLWPAYKARRLVRQLAKAPYYRMARYEAQLLRMGRSAVGALEEGAAHERMLTRRACVWLLGEARDPAGVEALIRALADPEWTVRGRAAEALGKIQSPRAAPHLVAVLGDPERQVRAHAATALGWLRHRAAVPALTARLEDDDPFVRYDALWALGRIDPAGARAHARRLRTDPNARVRGMAARVAAE